MALPAPSRAFFDQWSRTYDNPLVQALTYRPVHTAVLTELRAQRPGLVLDVGCGTGVFTKRIHVELGVDALGCDYSSGMIRQAARRGEGPAWVQANAMALPIASTSVDAVVCTESFHWYPDQLEALREFARVLVDGGRAYLALVNPATDLVSKGAHAWSRRAGQPFSWPTASRMRAMVEEAGLRTVRQQRLCRLAGGLLLPPVLTVAVKRA